METSATSIQSCWSQVERNWAFNTFTPWRKGPHRSSQECSSWPTTEVTTQGFTKLNNSLDTTAAEDLSSTAVVTRPTGKQSLHTRSWPDSDLLCKIGTNYQGASNQLHEIYNMLHSSSQMARAQDFLANEGCDWRFIIPRGPHTGGESSSSIHEVLHERNPRVSHATYEENCPQQFLRYRPV